MEEAIIVAGFALTKALDEINRTKMLHPFLISCNNCDSNKVKYKPEGLALEQTIPKVVNAYEKNEENHKHAIAVFPAELEDESGERESSIIVMAQDYETKEYITLSQPYKLNNGKLKVSKFELLDFSPFLTERLPELKEKFAAGALQYDDAEHIWSERFRGDVL